MRTKLIEITTKDVEVIDEEETLEEKDLKIEKLQNELSDLNVYVKILEKNNQTSLKARLDYVEKDNQSKKEENKELKQKLITNEVELEALQHRYKEVERQRDILEAKIDEKNAELTELARTIALEEIPPIVLDLQKTNDELANRIKQLETAKEHGSSVT